MNTGAFEPVGDPAGDRRWSSALRAVDHATVWVERPIRRLAGSARLNPLPHAGTISVFLLGVVLVSGLYLTLFFEFGHEASYRSVAAMEEHAIQRVARALHRYASAVLVLTTAIHGWRIFATGRFTGRLRRWRWATGVASLVLVWLAGVTGYWLVWDARAQALNEVVVGLVGGTAAGVGLAVDQLGVVGGRSGSGFLLLLWFLHLGLSAVIVWFVWRHLRRSKQPWLPPPLWMALMGVPLVIVSLALPVGMLGPADPEALVGELPLDPFVLFLLPPLLSSWRWVTLAVFAAAALGALVLPRLLRRRDLAPITIIDEACTGCELCAADCPYDAIRMIGRPSPAVDEPSTGDGPAGGRRVGELVAEVDVDRCVSCGVCLGSCAFGAIELPGAVAPSPPDLAGRPLVIACDRHLDRLPGRDEGGPEPDDEAVPVVHPVRCAGALAPEAVRRFAERGATDIQLVGCAPRDCRYGIGNALAAERLAGERRPHPPSRYARRVAQDWVAGDRLDAAMTEPGAHPELDTTRPPARREALVGVGVIAVLTALGVALATRAPFGSPSDELALRVVVDHRAGRVPAAGTDATPVAGFERIEVTLEEGSGRPAVFAIDGPADGERWAEIVDVDDLRRIGQAGDGQTGDGTAGSDDGLRVTAVAFGPDGVTPLAVVEFGADDLAGSGRRLVVDATDRPPAPGVDEGRRIFDGRQGGCAVCHSVDPGDDGVGPTLHGVAAVAADRVEGLDAEGYLRQSILLPDQYIVPGWPAGQMLPIYRDRLSADELDAVIAYLLTLDQGAADDDDGGADVDDRRGADG